MSEVPRLKKEFLKWLQDMKLDCVCNCDELPSELNPLFQSNKLKRLCKYLIHHVKTKEAARNVFENLNLQTLRSENNTMQQTCDDMSNELAQLNVNLQKLEEKVKQKKEKCLKSGFVVVKFQERVDSHNMKSLFQEHCANDVLTRGKSLNVLQKQLKNMSVTRPQLDEEKEQLFYSCSNEIKKLLLHVNQYYKRGFNGEGDWDKTDLWKATNNILFTYPPKVVVDVLSLITRQDTDKLASEKSSKFDENCEASSGETPMKAVQEMMENHHLESVNEFQEALKCEALASKIEKNNTKSVAHILDALPAGSDRKHVQELLDAEISLKGEEAFLRSLQSSVQNLETELDQNFQTQRQLTQLQQEMNNFNKELAKNKLEIVETTRQNADFRKKLANCQREIIQLAEVSLREKHDYLSRVSSIYQQALQEENAALQSVDVFKLMTLQTAQKEIPLHSLSINRQLNDCYEYGHDAYQRILALLGMRNHKFPADVFREVVKQIIDQQFLQQINDFKKALIPKTTEKVQEIQDVMEQSRSKCSKQSEKILTWIKEAQKSVKILKGGERKLEDALTDWYEQPAQNHAPWLEVDEKNFKKWKDENLT